MRTLIVSATNTLARGFQVVPTDRRSPSGATVNGLFALARGVLRALAFKAPGRAVAVIEAREAPAAWPAILKEQLAHVAAVCEALGLHVVRAEDELHVAASYAQRALDAGDDVVVVGMDKRFAQLVGERSWWYDANKDARYTRDMVVKRFGVGPEQVAEWLALVGDDDQLPGVAGIGAKGATGILEAHGSVAAAVANVESIAGRAGKALKAAQGVLPVELARARLDRDRPLPVPLDDLAYAPPAATVFNQMCKDMGFTELLANDGGTPVMTEVFEGDGPVAIVLATLSAPVSMQVLTEDPSPVRGALAGLALSSGDHEAVYLPIGDEVPAPLADWLADASVAKIGHDTKVVVAAFRRRGIEVAGIVGDSMVASHLAQPSNWAPHDLPIVAKQVLGRALPDEDGVRGVGAQRKPWAKVSADRAGGFAGTYADAAAEAWRALGPATDPALFAEYMALSATLVRMELAGIGVDAERLREAEAAFAPIEKGLETEIYALAGHPFNLGSTKQVGEVLFGELKLPVVSHTKTGWSTATEALERIDHAHPIVGLVIRWRALRRLTDSWITALHACIDPDGRVHACFHPARSFSGRIVNSNPDLGRVPGRTPEMAMIRRAFVARPGWVLMSVDYNQLGLHVLAHLTKDPALVEPLRARADVHKQTAVAVLEKPIEELTADDRQLGKVVNFATFAGQGASALALQLGVPAAEAKQLIERFDAHYGRVREFQDRQSAMAHELGYIVTIAGRKWPIGGLASLDSHDRSYAERLARRATHEGSVSDVSRRGLLDADTALRAAGLSAQPLVQILDEVLFEVPEGEVAEAARISAESMRHAFELEAPLRVGVEVGPNWADLAPYEVAT